MENTHSLDFNPKLNAKYLRDGMKAMQYQGKPRFILIDAVDFSNLHDFDTSALRHEAQRITNHC